MDTEASRHLKGERMSDTTGTDRLRAILVLVATLATVGFNFLAGAGFVNRVTPEMISDRYPVILTPAGYAFAIWSLIYFGLIAFSLYQLLGVNARRFRPVRSLYIASCVLDCAWLYFWHYDQIGISLATVAGLAAVLLWINIRLGCCQNSTETLLVQAPFGIYFGWVTAATLVNLMVFLKYMGLAAADSVGWGSVLLLVATGCGVAVRVALRNFFFPLAIAWAVTAIAVEQSGKTMLVVTAAVSVVICLITAGSFVTSLRTFQSE